MGKMGAEMKYIGTAVAVAGIACLPTQALAKAEPPQLVSCESSIGSIALVEGDVAGWSEYGLGGPRELINALAIESGCFTPHNAASGQAARFLVTAVAGDAEEVDKSIEMGKTAATEALVRSGAAGSVLTKVPFGGSALGMFGGLGGKKKTVAAGLRVVSPANGMTLASGSGSVKKSTLSFGGASNWADTAANASGYAGSKDGRMLTEAFVLAFNNLVAQRAAMDAAPAAATATAGTTSVAIDTKLRASPSATGAVVRSLRKGTELTPTGTREGLFLEVTDNYGTKGWVSVEDLD